MANPLIDDRFVRFLLFDVLDVEVLCALPHFAEHDRETFELYVEGAARFAREQLFPTYAQMDVEPPVLRDGRVSLHPLMQTLYPQMVELGMITATRPEAVGGAQLPHSVAVLATAYLMAGNLSAVALLGLTAGAGHLVEAFGDADLKATFMAPMYAGRWTGTMALTEPQAGSSLADVRTTAAPAADGTYRLRGAKMFISGGDHDVAENVVHLTLARIDGAPAGLKGVSLFAVPRLRPDGQGGLVDNDVATSQLIHKIGWRGLPSLGLNFGDRGDCHAWRVGEPGRGLNYMFQMMNEARLLVGAQGIATASVAFHEALSYARERTQGRPLGVRDPEAPPVPIIEHLDVRRMLLRQKAIVEGGFALTAAAARYADLAEHGADEVARAKAKRLLDLLTPVAKSFAAEMGYEANLLAIQVLGGYGYTSEYLPEALARDQKLNSLHEGTTGIQGLDLLGRKAMLEGGANLRAFDAEVREAIAADGVEPARRKALDDALDRIGQVTMTLGAKGMGGDLEGMLRNSDDYLRMFWTVAVAWQWVVMTTAARSHANEGFRAGLERAASYWFETELPKVGLYADRCLADSAAWTDMESDWF